MLLGKHSRVFKNIDRVDEKPEGYIVLKDEKGIESKLPERGDITDVTGLSPSECCNIFIVRNSDLSIAQDVTKESQFYTDITDRLTGLKTKEISIIIGNLREIGKLTPGNTFRDIRDEKLKTKIDKAERLINKIEDLTEEIEKNNYNDLEVKLIQKKEEIEEIEKKLKVFEIARKREEYEKGKEALEELKRSLKKLEELKVYNEHDEESWRISNIQIENFNNEKDELKEELEGNKGKFNTVIDEYNEKERKFKILIDRKKMIDDEIKPELKSYEMEVGKTKSDEIKNKFYIIALSVSLFLLSLSIIGTIINFSLIVSGLAIVTLISTCIFAALRLSFVNKKAHLEAVYERIKLIASKIKLDAVNPEGIYSNIQKFDEDYNRKYEELQCIKGGKDTLEAKIKELKEKRIPKIEESIKEAKNGINKIKLISREDSLEEYTKNFKLKQSCNKIIGEQQSILKSHFGEMDLDPNEKISYWEDKIRKLEIYKEKAKEITYNETFVSELNKKREDAELIKQEINDKITPIQIEMREIEREVNEISQLGEDHLYCRTSVDLEAINNNLQEFINKNEDVKDSVLKAIEIFKDIELTEKEKISEFFGKESPISQYFNEITNSLYEEVNFDKKEGKIEVIRNDGKKLGAEKLSGGAYDQLYLSIRIFLGSELLKGNNGFFIMDDPFIKADTERLQRQINLLMDISRLGWQILYFSAKDEVKKALKENIDDGIVNLIEVPGIFSQKI